MCQSGLCAEETGLPYISYMTTANSIRAISVIRFHSYVAEQISIWPQYRQPVSCQIFFPYPGCIYAAKVPYGHLRIVSTSNFGSLLAESVRI